MPPQEILKYSKAGLTQSVNEPDNHNSVITYLEPDILEYAVKWALESITMNKASRGDRIPAELFQILKDDAMKVQVFTTQSCLILCDPMNPIRLLCPWNAPGKNTGADCHALLQWIVPTQGSKL